MCPASSYGAEAQRVGPRLAQAAKLHAINALGCRKPGACATASLHFGLKEGKDPDIAFNVATIKGWLQLWQQLGPEKRKRGATGLGQDQAQTAQEAP